MSDRRKRRVAVIGAGPSGLVTAKELLAEGHEPVGFERAAGLGGVFRFDERDGVVWESCRLTSSGLLTAFSDFPVDDSRAGHLKIGEYVDYLTRYAERFDLLPRFHFSTRVERVERDPAGGWRVSTVDGASRPSEERFDAVAICTGLHQQPSVPPIEGLESFTGEVVHGARYRRPEQIAGKRVLVIGAGESGADLVAEVSSHAAETVLSLRRGVAVLPRLRFGRPNDYLTTRLLNSPAAWIFQTRHPDDDRKRTLYRYLFLPFVVVDKLLQLAYRYGWELRTALGARVPGAGTPVRENLATWRLTLRLLAESGGTANEQFGTKTDDFVRAIVRGRCRRAPGIARFDGERVLFEDGSEWRPEVVLFCTGFDDRVPFLETPLATAPRYLHLLPAGVDASLAFIGFLRPAYGAIPPLAELQARWFALAQSGAVPLPSEREMREWTERRARQRARTFRAVRDRLGYLVDHTALCDDLAAHIGCKPTRRALAAESRAFRRRFFEAPFVAAQYRLVGPHAEPELARRVIERLPIVHPWPDRANLRLRWWLSRRLHRGFGADYAPKLELAPD